MISCVIFSDHPWSLRSSVRAVVCCASLPSLPPVTWGRSPISVHTPVPWSVLGGVLAACCVVLMGGSWLVACSAALGVGEEVERSLLATVVAVAGSLAYLHLYIRPCITDCTRHISTVLYMCVTRVRVLTSAMCMLVTDAFMMAHCFMSACGQAGGGTSMMRGDLRQPALRRHSCWSSPSTPVPSPMAGRSHGAARPMFVCTVARRPAGGAPRVAARPTACSIIPRWAVVTLLFVIVLCGGLLANGGGASAICTSAAVGDTYSLHHPSLSIPLVDAGGGRASNQPINILFVAPRCEPLMASPVDAASRPSTGLELEVGDPSHQQHHQFLSNGTAPQTTGTPRIGSIYGQHVLREECESGRAHCQAAAWTERVSTRKEPWTLFVSSAREGWVDATASHIRVMRCGALSGMSCLIMIGWIVFRVLMMEEDQKFGRCARVPRRKRRPPVRLSRRVVRIGSLSRRDSAVVYRRRVLDQHRSGRIKTERLRHQRLRRRTAARMERVPLGKPVILRRVCKALEPYRHTIRLLWIAHHASMACHIHRCAQHPEQCGTWNLRTDSIVHVHTTSRGGKKMRSTRRAGKHASLDPLRSSQRLSATAARLLRPDARDASGMCRGLAVRHRRGPFPH